MKIILKMMFRFHYFILSLILIASNALASGRDVYNKTDSLYYKAWDIVESGEDLNLALKMSNEAIDMYAAEKKISGVIVSLYLQGYIYQNQKKFDLAAAKFFEGLEHLQNYMGQNKDYYKSIYFHNLGFVYEKTYSLQTSIDYYKESLDIANLMGFENENILNYNLGNVYYELEDYQNSLKYYNQALRSTSINDSFYVAKINNSIGNLYNITGKFALAKEHYLRAIALQKDLDNKEYLPYYISNLGENLFKQDKIDESIDYYKEALSLALNLEDYIKAKALHNDLGDAYFAQGNYQKAIEQFEKSIALGNPEVLDPEYQRASQNIAHAYEKIGDFQKALHYQDNVIAQSNILKETREKLLEQNSQYRMKEVEWMLEKQAKEAKLSYVQAENFWFKVSMTLLFLILIGASYKAYRYYRGIRLVKKWLAAEV